MEEMSEVYRWTKSDLFTELFNRGASFFTIARAGSKHALWILV